MAVTIGEGQFKTSVWEETRKNWVIYEITPINECDMYGSYGAYGNCWT